MRNGLLLALCLILTGTLARAQLVNGDIVMASTTGITHFRGATITTATPVGSNATYPVPATFGSGSLLFIPGTSTMLISTNTVAPFDLWLLDFSVSLSAPTATRLGSTPGAIINMALDRVTGDAYLLAQTAPASIYRIPGPINAVSAVPATAFATGQTSAQALIVVSNSTLLTGNTLNIWAVTPGATAPGTTLLTLATGGLGDFDYDAANNQLLVNGFGNSRVDVYNLNTNAFVNTCLMMPQVFICDAIDYDETSGQVYALSRTSSTIGGLPYGVQASNDNVIVRNSLAGPSSAAIGVTPSTGHGNNGGNPYFALVKSFPQVVNAIQLTPNAATLAFNAGAGTVTATGTVASVLGVPNITSSMTDPLVGSTVVMNASFTGTDMASLSDIILSNVTLDFFVTAPPPGMSNLTASAATSMNLGPIASFTGALNATPQAVRRYSLTSPTTMSSGSSSTALPLFASRVGAPNTTLTLNFQLGGVPYLSNIFFNPSPGLTGFQAKAVTSGNGNFELGVINSFPVAQLYNLFTTMISTPLGSGPFLGLAADPFLFTQIGSSLGTQPFHVLADVNGQYRFALPAGSVPVLTADFVVAQFAPPTFVQILPPQRISF